MRDETMGKRKKKALPTPDEKGKGVETGHVPNQEKQEEEGAIIVTKREKVPAPRIKVRKKGGVLETSVDHPEPVVGHALLREIEITNLPF